MVDMCFKTLLRDVSALLGLTLHAIFFSITYQGTALKGDREIHLSRIHQKQWNIVVAIWSASNAITL